MTFVDFIFFIDSGLDAFWLGVWSIWFCLGVVLPDFYAIFFGYFRTKKSKFAIDVNLLVFDEFVRFSTI